MEDEAADYLELHTLDAELEISKRTRDARQPSLDLTKALQRGGNDTRADVKQAEDKSCIPNECSGNGSSATLH